MAASFDHFERLPDSLLLLIFNRVSDVKALGRCSAISKRFCSLIPLVEDLVVKVDCVIPVAEEVRRISKGKGLLACLCHLLLGGLYKPYHALQRALSPKKSAVIPDVSHHSPREVIRNFRGVRSLKIELPAGEMGKKNGALLKWRADFGSTLESCEILAASSLINFDKQMMACQSPNSASMVHFCDDCDDKNPDLNSPDFPDSISESFTNNGSLKLRVIWTISSLIAASARHYLLHQIILDHPTLECLVLADADGQGTLQMGKEQLHNFRQKPFVTSPLSKRTQVPALNIELWYAPFLVLPGGAGMRGATLVAIRPSNEVAKQETDKIHSFAFEEPFRIAASTLAGMRRYLLEMNSF